ncbi:hypothetical protein [Bremerella cremea]|uniref:hypothetical protein n=1 Tax=Bremerella cremea TaxID=1031537 RepID=UPI0031F0CA3F
MSRFRFQASVGLVMAWAVMLSAGCGSTTGEISGRVFLDGRPLDGAVIRFKPKGNPEAKEITAEITQGSFTVANSSWVKPGEYYVTVVAQQPGAGAIVQSVQRGEGIPVPKAFVPKVYEKKGVLSATFHAGKPNPLLFQLSSGAF